MAKKTESKPESKSKYVLAYEELNSNAPKNKETPGARNFRKWHIWAKYQQESAVPLFSLDRPTFCSVCSKALKQGELAFPTSTPFRITTNGKDYFIKSTCCECLEKSGVKTISKQVFVDTVSKIPLASECSKTPEKGFCMACYTPERVYSKYYTLVNGEVIKGTYCAACLKEVPKESKEDAMFRAVFSDDESDFKADLNTE